MIRGLFIGFLILSALAPKSAEIQNVNITDIANLLPEPGTACTDNTNGSYRPGCCHDGKDHDRGPLISGANDSQKSGSIQNRRTLLSKPGSCVSGQRDVPVWVEPVAVHDSLPLFLYIGQNADMPVCSGELYRVSGLSPPIEVC